MHGFQSMPSGKLGLFELRFSVNWQLSADVHVLRRPATHGVLCIFDGYEVEHLQHQPGRTMKCISALMHEGLPTGLSRTQRRSPR